MNDRWTEIRQVFREALDVELAEREVFLSKRCAHDPELRARVASMLEAYDKDDTFLEKPAFELGHDVYNQLNKDSLIGSQVGPYLIRRTIAQGGMGVVFEALDTKLEKIVALKMMNPALMQDVSFKHRFEQEAKTLARLEDPHFVRVHALIEEKGKTFIVMEFVHGITLAEHIRVKSKLSPLEVAGIGMQLLLALSKAHKQHIIHRDLKPSNIMLTRTDEGKSLVKVLDFGIAKQIQGDGKQTRTTGTVGTLFYMSPEQIRGLRSIDHRTDIYSVGVTLYEALHGDLPFDITQDEYTIRKQIVEGMVLTMPHPEGDSANPVGEVLYKAMSKNPGDRYQSAEEMRIALRAAVQQLKGSSPNRPPSVPSSRHTPPNNTPAQDETVLLPQNRFSLKQVAIPVLLIVLTGLGITYGLGNISRNSNQQTANGPDSISSPPLNESSAIQTATPQHAATSTTDSSLAGPTTLPMNQSDLPIDVEEQNDIPTPNITSSDQESLPGQNEELVVENDIAGISESQQLDPSTADTIESSAFPPDSMVPSQQQFGDVVFKIRPSGDIYIDDQLHARGQIINTVSLPTRSYLFTVANGQQRSWACNLPVTADHSRDVEVLFDQTVTIPIVALDIDTNKAIPNVPIYLDGVASGFTTPQTVKLSNGLHHIEVRDESLVQVDIIPEGATGCYQKIDHRINVDANDLNSTATDLTSDTIQRIVVYVRPSSP